jgi:hypothetical protein
MLAALFILGLAIAIVPFALNSEPRKRVKGGGEKGGPV